VLVPVGAGFVAATSLRTPLETSLLRTPTLDVVPPMPPGLLGAGAAAGASAGRGAGALEKLDFDEDEEDDEDRLPLELLLLRPILPANDSVTVANNVLAMIAEARSLLSFIRTPV
jgi:hypothetical protein